MKDATTKQLLAKARETARKLPHDPYPQATHYRDTIESLCQAIERQDARLAALERQPHGPPLEGTGPLPLERK